MSLHRSIAAACDGITAQWPGVCAVCRGWGTRRVCDACVQRFAAPRPRCRHCALPVGSGVSACAACLREPPPFARALAAVDYDHPWDALITRFKFRDALDLAPSLADRLVAAYRRSAAAAPAMLLPVPLSDARLRERGYNQAWELARRVARALDRPADARLLLRTRDTAHQLAHPPAERTGNVRAAFAVAAHRADEVRGRSLTLVDDVMTTGATLAEAARTLLAAGAAEVDVWVVARTPEPERA